MVVLLVQFRNSHLVNKNNKSERITYHGNRVRIYRFWQGHKDLNPEPTVLETAALPIELYPYIKFGGPSGTRTRDRPVMSRML